MSADRWEWNLGEFVDMANEALDDCEQIAETVASTARASAPVGDGPTSGNYRDSIHVVVDRREGFRDFARAHVVSDARYAAVVEARTGNLTRALNAAS